MQRAGNQNTYNPSVRIQNYLEDIELNAHQTADYLHRKENGLLLSTQIQKLLNKSLQEVQLTFAPDGFLKFGDNIMMYSVATEGVASVDLSTEIVSLDKSYAVTTSTLTQAPVARNVFTIEPYRQGQVGDKLRLGDSFRLRCSDKIAEGAYLASQPKSMQSFAKRSGYQEMYVTTSNMTADTVFKAVFKEIDRRFEMEGEPVPANAELVLVHVATGTALYSSKTFAQLNDFGSEFEFSGHSNVSIKKKQGLQQEAVGRTTSDIPVRAEGTENHFAFLTAAESSVPAASTPATETEL